MSLSDADIQKIYIIRDKLLITYKAATTESAKKRISKDLSKINSIITDIENGKWVNPVQLNIFSDSLTHEKISKENVGSDNNYLDMIEIEKISEINHDPEIDEIYSFLTYFEKNFVPPMSQSYLKLDYNLSKKRDDFFVQYDAIQHLKEGYIDDLEVFASITQKDQIDNYRTRMAQQKKYMFIKMSDVFNEFRDLLKEIIGDLDSGRKSMFNANERFESQYESAESSELQGLRMEQIVRESRKFANEFISFLRIPDFKNK